MLDLDSRRIASSAPLGAHQSKLATLQDRPRPAVPVTYLQRMCFIASWILIMGLSVYRNIIDECMWSLWLFQEGRESSALSCWMKHPLKHRLRHHLKHNLNEVLQIPAKGDDVGRYLPRIRRLMKPRKRRRPLNLDFEPTKRAVNQGKSPGRLPPPHTQRRSWSLEGWFSRWKSERCPASMTDGIDAWN